jgi:hypothetical protein
MSYPITIESQFSPLPVLYSGTPLENFIAMIRRMKVVIPGTAHILGNDTATETYGNVGPWMDKTGTTSKAWKSWYAWLEDDGAYAPAVPTIGDVDHHISMGPPASLTGNRTAQFRQPADNLHKVAMVSDAKIPRDTKTCTAAGSAAITLDLDNSSDFIGQLSQNITQINWGSTTLHEGQTVTIVLYNNGTAYTVASGGDGTVIKWIGGAIPSMPAGGAGFSGIAAYGLQKINGVIYGFRTDFSPAPPTTEAVTTTGYPHNYGGSGVPGRAPVTQKLP